MYFYKFFVTYKNVNWILPKREQRKVSKGGSKEEIKNISMFAITNSKLYFERICKKLWKNFFKNFLKSFFRCNNFLYLCSKKSEVCIFCST